MKGEFHFRRLLSGVRYLRGLLHNGMGQPTQLIINKGGVLVGALQGYDDVSDPNMKVVRQSVDTALRSKTAASAP